MAMQLSAQRAPRRIMAHSESMMEEVNHMHLQQNEEEIKIYTGNKGIKPTLPTG